MSRNKDLEVVVPLWFTTSEGGKWWLYEGSGFTMKQLRGARQSPLNLAQINAPVKANYYLTATKTSGIRHTKYIVHALAFTNPTMSWRYVARWDVVNGWTVTRYQAWQRLQKLKT